MLSEKTGNITAIICKINAKLVALPCPNFSAIIDHKIVDGIAPNPTNIQLNAA